MGGIIMDEDLILFSTNAIRSMEVIDISNGSKLGYVKNFRVDVNEQRVVSLMLPSPNKGWFSKEDDIEVPWEKVIKLGVDVLLIDGSDIQRYFEEK
jgi:YlmC/YmxH family sporulation protein